MKLVIRAKNGGYIPKSGIILARYLRDNVFFGGMRVLDIGTGEVGFLAHYVYALGAFDVLACDADLSAICHAKNCSNVSNKINWMTSDVFDAFSIDQIANRFDIILSNPPQLPMKKAGTWHDYGFNGSRDGRAIILRIIKNSPKFLNSRGKIFMLIFDFLGINKSFNSKPSICEIAGKLKMNCRVVSRYAKYVRFGGETERNLDWITRVYPKYQFQNSGHGRKFNVCVVEFSL